MASETEEIIENSISQQDDGDGESDETIVENPSSLYNVKAQALLEDALTAELDLETNRSKEAAAKLEESKIYFAKASNVERVEKLEHKIAGNEIFNAAAKLQREAFELYDRDDETAAADKYDEAMEMLKKAKIEFEKAVELSENKMKSLLEFVDATLQHLNEFTLKLRAKQLHIAFESLMFVGRPDLEAELLQTNIDVDKAVDRYCQMQMML